MVMSSLALAVVYVMCGQRRLLLEEVGSGGQN